MVSLERITRKFRGKDPRNILTKTDAATLTREVTRIAYGESRSAAKKLAEDSGQSPKAAENWLAGENPMGLTAFLNAYRSNPTFKAWARKILLEEEDHDPQFQADLAKFIQAVQRKGA